MMRRLIVHALYVTAEAIQLAADAISPPGDEVWRDRAWKRYLMNKGRLDEYAGGVRAPRPRSRALQRIMPPPCWSYDWGRVRADDE